MFVNKQSRGSNFDNFQPVDNMNADTRAQQYAFNGRIFFDKNESVKPYELYQDSSQQQNTSVSLISNIIVPNALAMAYFSNDNVCMVFG